MNRLNALFEEDIQMQDALEDLGELSDNSDDILLSSIENRYDDANKIHLFDKEPELDEDGLTPEEEAEVAKMLLDDDEDEADEDLGAAEDEEDLLDDAMGNDDNAEIN